MEQNSETGRKTVVCKVSLVRFKRETLKAENLKSRDLFEVFAGEGED